MEPTVLWAQNVHFTGFRAPFSLFMVNIVEYYWQSTVEPVIGTNWVTSHNANLKLPLQTLCFGA